jgi:hypothetical protein
VSKRSPLGLGSGVLARRHKPPKPRRVKTSNTGFCVECDDHCWRVLADLFGYKLAEFILSSAAAQGSVQEEVELQTYAARVAGQKLGETTTIFHGADPAPMRPTDADKARKHVRAYRRADDVWLQLLDEASGRWFYYNVSSGETTWVPPPTFATTADFA